MTGFWREFLKKDNSFVCTAHAAMLIAFVLATPIILLSCAAVVYHVFLLRKGLDAAVVNLLLGMLGAATGGVIGAGISMVTKTTISTVPGLTLTPKANPAPPAPKPE